MEMLNQYDSYYVTIWSNLKKNEIILKSLKSSNYLILLLFIEINITNASG